MVIAQILQRLLVLTEQQFQTVKNADKSLKAAQEAIMSLIDSEKINAEQYAFKFYPYLATEEYLTYYKDPFREENCSRVWVHSSYSLMDDEELISHYHS